MTFQSRVRSGRGNHAEMPDSNGNVQAELMGIEGALEIEAVDWASLVDHRVFVQADETLEQVHRRFQQANLRYMAVLDQERAIGLCAGRRIGLQLGSQYGFSLFAKAPVWRYRLPNPLIVRIGQPCSEVLQRVFSRTGESFNEDVLLEDEASRFLGLISVQTLVRLQTRLFLHSIDRLQDQQTEISRRNRQMTDDLLMAREVQMALLPRELPKVPSGRVVGGGTIRMLSHYVPVGVVSGDFYEVLAISDTAVAVIIADVMGHGVQAALVTAMLRALMQSHRRIATDPGDFLAALNLSLCEILEGCRLATFVSAFALVADVAVGTLRFANAGHPAPILLQSTTGIARTLDGETQANGGVLGVSREAAFPAGVSDLAAGDLVLMFTDGLFEIPGADGEILGTERLTGLAARLVGRSGEELIAALIESVRSFSPQGRFEDDVCLLGLEILENVENLGICDGNGLDHWNPG